MSRFIFSFLFVLFYTFSFSQTQQENVVGAHFEAFSLEEMDKQSAFVDANQQIILGNFDKAIELLDKFLYLNDRESAAWYTLSKAHLSKKEFTKALEAVQKATQLEPNNQWFLILQANLYEETGRAKEAAVLYEKLIKLYPNTEMYYHTLGYYYVLSGAPDKGLATYNLAEQRFGISPETIDKKYLVYLASGDMVKAQQELEKLVTTYPNNIEYRKRLAQFYAKIGDKKLAKLTYEKVLVYDATDAEARLFIASNGPTSAVASTNMQDIIADPKADIDAKIKRLLPLVAKLQESLDPALANELMSLAILLEKAHPTEAKAWSFSGDVHYLSEKDDLALEKYQRCISLNPIVYSVWENTLEILYDKGDYKKLAKTAEDAIDAFPNQALSYYFYGFAKNKLLKASDALPLLMQAKLMVGGNPGLSLDIQDQIGLSELLLGKTEEAKATLSSVLELSKNQHPGALEHWGDVLAKEGKASEAVQFWQKAYQLNPSAALQLKLN